MKAKKIYTIDFMQLVERHPLKDMQNLEYVGLFSLQKSLNNVFNTFILFK